MVQTIDDKPTPLPPGHIKEVVVANSPVTDTVKNAIENLNLPPGIQQQIDDAQVGTSERTMTESQISWLDGEIQLIENELVQLYLEQGDTSAVISLLGLSDRAESKKTLAGLYFDMNQTIASRAEVYNTILFSKPGELYENTNYSSLLNLLLDLTEDYISVFNMDSLQEQTVREVALTYTNVAVRAENILYCEWDKLSHFFKSH